MKILCFILSIFIISVSTIPCCTNDDCIEDGNTITQTKSHEDSCSTCSPFLTCGTCLGFIFQCNEIVFQTPIVSIDKNAISRTKFFVANGIAKIWQPPKIS